jgi:hypothetical protein
LAVIDSVGLGEGGAIGTYGFFAFIKPARSEKLSRWAGLQRLAAILLLMDPVSEMGLTTVLLSSARLIRSSSASGRELAMQSHLQESSQAYRKAF